MKQRILRNTKALAPVLLPVAAGFLAGMTNGLLGAGGGIIAVFALSRMLRSTELDRRDIYANALCMMLPISAVSCVRYALAGHLVTDRFGAYAIPAIAGGLAGGILLGRLGDTALKRLFGLLVIWSGVLLILR